jgi:hypothetical protein
VILLHIGAVGSMIATGWSIVLMGKSSESSNVVHIIEISELGI